jgi:glycerol-3-phosphate dehydrogenase
MLCAVLCRGVQDGRVVFMLPFQGAVIAGTTDAPCPLTDRPRAHAEEVEFILAAISDFLNIKVRVLSQHAVAAALCV